MTHRPRSKGSAKALFALTGTSNISNSKNPLSLIKYASSLGYSTLLDAAALAPHSIISLWETPVDAMAVSFYKMFGFPTGVGALVVKKSFLSQLKRPWFSGGNVDVVQVPGRLVTRSHELHEQFEVRVSFSCSTQRKSAYISSTGRDSELYPPIGGHRRTSTTLCLYAIPSPQALLFDNILGFVATKDQARFDRPPGGLYLIAETEHAAQSHRRTSRNGFYSLPDIPVGRSTFQMCVLRRFLTGYIAVRRDDP